MGLHATVVMVVECWRSSSDGGGVLGSSRSSDGVLGVAVVMVMECWGSSWGSGGGFG